MGTELDKKDVKADKPAKDAEQGKAARTVGAMYSFVRIILIFVLIGYLVWTLAKDNPKFKRIIDRFTTAQVPADRAGEMLSSSGETMGTFWNVKVYMPPKGWTVEKLTEAVREPLDRIDLMMSTYRPDSEVSRFNASESTDWFEVSLETALVVKMARDVSEKTGGALDITVAPLVNFWKFGPDKKPLEEFPSDDEIEKVRAKTGFRKLEVRINPPALKKSVPELSIDLSAIAKGYSVDLVVKALRDAGLENFMVDVGGETYCAGSKGEKDAEAEGYRNEWLMAIEKPQPMSPGAEGESVDGATPQFYRIVRVKDMAIATSGNARNAFMIGGKRFSHIIDPERGRPTEFKDGAPETGSVSVFGPECVMADAYATALFVLGPDKGIELADSLELPVLFILHSPDGGEGEGNEYANGSGGYTERVSKKFSAIRAEKMTVSRRY